MTLNDLTEIESLNGTEMVPVEQDGVWYKVNLSRFLNTTPATITAAPTGLTATPIDPNNIDLAWTSSAALFTVERSLDESSWEQIYQDVTNSYSDLLLEPDNQYFYRVRAADIGEIPSDWVYTDATTPAV